MKKIFLILMVLLFACFLTFAKKRQPLPQQEPDVYDDENVTSITIQKKDPIQENDPYSKQKMKPKADRSVGQKLLGLGKFQQIEPFSVYVNPNVGKMKLKRAHLIHREATDIGGFYCYYDTSAYAVQFASGARNILISAINQYLDDFAGKRLDRNAKLKNTQAIYGSAEGYEEYGVAIAMLKNYARPEMCFGYAFVNGNPYFSIYAKKTKNLAHKGQSNDDPFLQNTIPQRYYFTKAQAQTLATFLSDENIEALRASTSYDLAKEGEGDVYVNLQETEQESSLAEE